MIPSTQVVAATSTSTGVINFQVNQVTNWASLKLIWDLYRIVGAKITLIPHMNSSTTESGGGTGPVQTIPTLYIAPNRDPFVPAPTSIDDVLNDDFCKIRMFNKPLKMYLKSPKHSNPVRASDGTFIGMDQTQLGVSKKFQYWLPTGGNSQTYGADDFSYYGFRYFIDNTGSHTEFDFEIIYTVYIELKEQD